MSAIECDDVACLVRDRRWAGKQEREPKQRASQSNPRLSASYTASVLECTASLR